MGASTFNVLSLCSGIGGLDLAVRRVVPNSRTVAYVEREAFCVATMAAQMERGGLDAAPIWSDLLTFDGRPWRGVVDCVIGGFPCQPFSVAGKKRGTDDERWLWPGIVRILRDIEPAIVFLENVPGLVALGLAEVLGDLAGLGFAAEWGCLAASDVGAPHQRKRIFILAYAEGGDRGLQLLARRSREAGAESVWRGEAVADAMRERSARRRIDGDVAGEARTVEADGEQRERGGDAVDDRGSVVGDAESKRLEGRIGGFSEFGCSAWPPSPSDSDGWREWIAAGGPKPVLRRDVDGDAAWLDRSQRLRALGNGVVPVQAEKAFLQLYERVIAWKRSAEGGMFSLAEVLRQDGK